jgi:CheY-like chemotaxis protein
MRAGNKNKRILSVDDDPFFRKCLQAGLEQAGYETLAAGHGRQAMDLVRREAVDLLTVDLLMPVVDGLRLLRWLRQEAGLTTPVLVISALTGEEVVREALSAGASTVLAKPAPLEQILRKVAQLLKG